MISPHSSPRGFSQSHIRPLVEGAEGRRSLYSEYSGTPNSEVPRYWRIILNSGVTSLYRVEAVTSDFDTAKMGPFAIQDTAISGPRL